MATAIETLQGYLKDLNTQIHEEALKFDREANGRKRMDIFIRAISAILAVAAPALVTYEPGTNAAGFVGTAYFKVLVIFLVGFAGASITLQAVFAFDRKYANAKMAAVNLLELERKIDFDLRLSDLSGEHESYRILKNRFETAAKRRTEILRQYVQEDINTVLSTDARVQEVTTQEERSNPEDTRVEGGRAPS